jgi:hypothetical protein
MQVNQIEIDNSLIENAVKISGLYNKKELIEKALLFFTQQAIEKSKSSVEKNQSDLLMSFSGKVKFDRDGLEYQNSIRDEWE